MSFYSYNYQKALQDTSLTRFIPRVEFKNAFQKEVEVFHQSFSTFYKVDDFFKSIDIFFSENKKTIEKKKFYQYYNYNTNYILSEVLYINHTDNIVYAFSSSDIDDIFDYELPRVLSPDDEDDYSKTIESFDDKRYKLSIEVYSLLSSEHLAKEFLDKFLSIDKESKKKENELCIITKNDYGLSLRSFQTNKQEIDLDLNYNDDLKEVYQFIVDKLNQKDNDGIVLLSGEKGTGKSTLLRLLTRDIIDKKLIYMPPDMSGIIADPEFISFMLLHKNSVLIIEDAENVLKARSAGGSQAVSNLLNITNGLLGDVLKLQVVCTFNCDINQIDDALLRPGRLIAEYRFCKLTIDKTNKLLNKLFPDINIKVDKEMTLAEIYNFNTKQYLSKSNNNSIGFKK